MNIGQKLSVIVAVPILMLTSSVVFAEDDADTWEFSLATYLWAVGLDGEMVVKGQPVDIDVDFDELLDDVDYAVQLQFEARKNDWSFIVDSTIVKMEADQQSGPFTAEVELDYLLTELLAGYRIAPRWDLLGGVRHWVVDAKIDSQGPPPRVDADEDWVDLVVGARFFTDISEKWSFVGRVDIGGFDIGESADFTWSVSTLFSYDFGRNKQFVAGYRALDVDFDDGGDRGTPFKFKFDVEQSGPVFGLSFNWPKE